MSYRKKIIKDFDISSFKMSGGMIGGGGVNPPTTTKGDISGYDTTYARIPVGTNDQVLTADSTQALGLKWADSSGGTEFNDLNAAGTYNPTKQTGLMHIVFNKGDINSGTVKWYIDGVLQDTYDSSTAAGQYNEIKNPTTSISFVAAAGTWSQTAYNGNISPTSGYGIIADYAGADMSPDGQYMFRTGDRRMLSFTLPTDYDLTSIGSYTSYDTQTFGSRYPYSARYGDSGTYIFAGVNNGVVWRMTCDNGAYRWTNDRCGTAGQVQTYDSSTAAGVGGNPIYGMDISSDGTKLYCAFNGTNNVIHEFDMSTAWDLTTASYNSNTYNTTMSASDMRAFAISKDGVWLYTTTGAAGSSLLYRHQMSTPWDITTATIDSTSINISTLLSYTSQKLNMPMFVTKNDTLLAIGSQNVVASQAIRFLELQTVFSGNFETAIS